MSKAEERVEEYCHSTLVGSSYIKKMAYLKGYHQAEKDLELSWEDMMAIDDLLDELLPPRRDSDELVLKGYYEEVLKRFKDFKERKQQ